MAALAGADGRFVPAEGAEAGVKTGPLPDSRGTFRQFPHALGQWRSGPARQWRTLPKIARSARAQVIAGGEVRAMRAQFGRVREMPQMPYLVIPA